MATINLTITVDDIATVIGLFDKIKVYRSTTGIGGPFVELTTAPTRIDLVSGESLYSFVDTTGDAAFFYTTSFFNSSSSAESSQSAPIQGDTDPLYISVQDVRDAGVTTAQASNSQVLMLIKAFQEVIERVTRNFFVPKQMTLEMDGGGHALMQLPWAIISVSDLFINDEFDTAVDPAAYLVYNGRGESGRDDRRNPRIKIKISETSIFTGTGSLRRRTTIFEVGEKNQRIVGTFGYTDADGCVPETIQYALTKLVVQNIDKVTVGGSSPFSGPIIEEETDRHRRKYADVLTGSKAWSATGDPQIDQMLAMFRGPWAMSAPRTQFKRLTGGQIIAGGGRGHVL